MKRILIILFAAFLILIPYAAHADITTGLVSRWALDETSGTTAADSAGSNTGTLMGGASFTSSGKIGGAINFNGTNAYVDLPDNANLKPTPITLSAWFYANAAAASDPQGRSYIAQMHYNDFGIYETPYAFGTLNADAYGMGIIQIPEKTPQMWHHAVLTSDGATTKFYVDGALAGTMTGTLNWEGGVHPPSIGAASGGALDFFNGKIDDVRVYSRALSASDVSELYAATGGTSPANTTYTLSVTSPTNGTVSSSPSGITCPGTCSVSNISAGTSYTLTATPSNGYTTSWSGCASTNGNACTVTVNSDTTVTPTFTTVAIADTTAPSIPTALSASAVSATQVNLSWTASTDASGIGGYKIYRCTGAGCTPSATPAFTTTGSATSYSDTTTSASTAYTYTVAAYDAATPANTSVQSGSASVTTGAAAAISNGSIPSSRTIDWSNTGVPGGIPNRTTICATLGQTGQSASFAQSVTAAQINAAIASCPANQVVYLSAGTYTLSAPITFDSKSNITLRGAGPASTILVPQNSAWTAITSGGNALSTTGRSILSGATKGSRSIVVSDVTGIQAGTMLDLYEANDPDIFWSRWGGTDMTGQFLMVTGVNANTKTITFEDPLVYDFSFNPRYKYFMYSSMKWGGVEDLAIKPTDSAYGGAMIAYNQTYASWIKNVETAWGAGNAHIQLTGALRNEIRDSYIHDTYSTGDGYGIITVSTSDAAAYGRGGSTGLRIENNIFSGFFHGMVLEAEVGSAVLFNFFRNSRFTGWPDYEIADINANHGPHGMMNLFEGNIAVGFINDGYHGSTGHLTLFRNNFSGKHVDANRTGNMVTVKLTRYSYYHNLVGNILGSNIFPASTIGRYEMTGQPGYTQQPVIYSLGYPNVGNNGYSLTNPPSNGDDGGLDPKVKATLLRSANYDYFHSCTWDDTASRCLTNGEVSSLGLASSLLYGSSRPLWWPASVTWPPIGPDVSGLVNKIPAQLCYEQNRMPNCLSAGGSSQSTTYTVSVTLAGTGSGTVTSSAAGITCGATCSASFNNGTTVVLTATAANGSTFTSWSGCSSTTGSTCTVSGAATPVATFTSSAPADTTAPSVSISSPVNSATVSGTVSLAASASDNVGGSGMAGVQFQINSQNLGVEVVNPPYAGNWDTTGATNGTYIIKAIARDAAGNIATSTAVSVTVNNIVIGPDLTAPTVPTNLAAVAANSTQVNLSWTASTDPQGTNELVSGVAGYRIYRNNTLITTVTGTSYSDSGLTQLTTYSYKIAAIDAASPVNVSAQTSVVSASTPATPPPPVPPVLSAGSPTSALAAGTIRATLSLSTDKAAICKYSTVANTAYAAMTNTFTTTGGTTHSTSISNLTDGSTYTYYVRCDSTGLTTTSDYIISFSVSNPPVVTTTTTGTGGGGTTGGGSTGGTTSGIGSFTPLVQQPTSPTTNPNGTACTPTTIPSTLAPLPTGTTNFTIGTRSAAVTTLQTFLVSKGYLTRDSITGYYGPLTNAAVVKYKAALLPRTVACPTTATGATGTSRLAKGYQFTATLIPFATNAQVKSMQIFLNDHGYTVATTGSGSKGNETTYFGNATKAALIKFQKANNVTPAIGNWGPLTRAKVNSMLK